MRWRLITLLVLLAALAGEPARADMVNRWSFNNAPGSAPAGTMLVDSISGAVATVRGNGSTFNGAALTITGTTNGNQTAASISGYVDLPNGIISSKTNLTVEVWATPITAKNWMRVFDFGRVDTAGVGGGAAGEITGTTTTAPGATTASDNLMLSFCRGTNLALQRMQALVNGGSTVMADSALATTAGTQYHYVLTFEDGLGVYGSSGGRLTWYRDGVLVATGDVMFHLADLEDVNNWLGRSQYSGDQNANAAYNEVRIYDHAMSAAEAAESFAAGPEMGLTYRWSFTATAGSAPNGTVLMDLVSGAPAVVRGQGATLTGSALVLPGTTTGNATQAAISAYVDLPNGIVSRLESVTIEAWATPVSSKNWQRLVVFGNMAGAGDGLGATGEWTGGLTTAPGTATASDEFGLTLNLGGDLNQQRLATRLNHEDQTNGVHLVTDTALPTTAGQAHHYVITFEGGAGSFGTRGGRAIWYRDGVVAATVDVPFRLADLNDVNNWLGRSEFTADSMANVSLDEFRVYNFAFTPLEVVSSRDAGPNATIAIPPPTTSADSVVMHRGQKALIAVLDNDTGLLQSSTVAVATLPTAGSATVDGSGRIRYANTNSLAASDSFTYTVRGPGGVSAPALVTVTFSNALRISNPALALPAAPPPTVIQTIDALPGVTFTQPICIASIPGDSHRLFVCERLAKIRVIPDVTAAQPTSALFLDLQGVVSGRSPTETIEGGGNDEHGLLGLAFHPNYATNGYFYAAYTVRISGGSYYQRISRFKVSAANPNQADPASELILLQQLDRGPNHDGGDLHFGPDGYLYYSAGDEEAQRDVRHNSQKIDLNFFSGIFRIDVDKKPGNLAPNPHSAIPTDGGVARFSVPADNPFIHTSLGGTWDGKINGAAIPDLTKVRTEFWAFGFRNPWRFSFDPVTGTLWEGDVGQDIYEEINIVQKGGNYGWVYREGAHDTAFTNPVPIPQYKTDFPSFTSIDPVYEYVHSAIAGGDAQFKGNSVCGGVVYRGSRFPWYGSYIFCDSVSGHIWKRDGTTGVVTRLTGVAGAYGGLVSMGVDPSNQDVLFADYINGRILRLASGTLGNSFPATLSETGLFADLTDLSPNPGLLPYAPNLAFWSDYAIKQRWFAIPDASGLMTWSRDENWTFPTGMLWVKHFDLELTRNNPATKKRIETRVLVKTDTSLYGVSYRWNDAQTEATLVPDEGVSFPLTINVSGSNYTQTWQIPSRSSCLTCHTPPAGHALSFTTRQLNRVENIHGFAGNQLDLLSTGGFFINSPGSTNLLPRHLGPNETLPDGTLYPVEARVRSFVAVNCANCHRQGGTGGGDWDGRPQLTLAQTKLINGTVVNNGGNSANLLIVPGDTIHSVVFNRVSASNGFTRMPPLASSELDQADIALLQEWITQSLPNQQTYNQWRFAQFGSSISLEGAADADPDGDGRTNTDEFLALTNPLDGASFIAPQVLTNGSNVTFSFTAPANRSAFVYTSLDLVNWSLWDVSGNNGIPLPGGPVTITGPMLGSKQFFRLRLQEN